MTDHASAHGGFGWLRAGLSLWLGVLTLPLLYAPSAVKHFEAAGLPPGLRFVLAALELTGAVLFVPRRSISAGAILLLLSFLGAGWIHLRLGRVPWLLGVYTAGVIGLWLADRRAEVGRAREGTS